ncbi:alginate lyase [Lewinellaceae bacterium SD302]|nr:alginate lyase [Lewinellaceae bacterium SD302]
MNHKTVHLFSVLLLLLVSCESSQPEVDGILVSKVAEFDEAVQAARPGDRIILANGIWTDVELKFSAKGTAEDSIYIVAQEKGKVFFEGQSNLKMGGEYLHLEGIVFRNGFTPTSSVISLQQDNDTPCNHCRVTECVVDNYNPSERFDTDYWVEIYGKHNRFDHNYLVGKRNRGVTLAVRMKNERDRENYHSIDHNYFGYNPILGSNGGETLRIGTSHFSLSNANTTVADNYFEHCNGEHEIISSKSCQNVFRNNTFFECQGTLTMRHGNETLVENNYFFGNRKANTGGIRIINETQTVNNNYLSGLTGHRLRGALVIMNGVPDSPINRYFQVKDSKMERNLVVDSDYIQLCAGSDEERSATPINTTFRDNVILNSRKKDLFTIYDDVSGITFANNQLSPGIEEPVYAGRRLEGFEDTDITVAADAKNVTLPDGTLIGPDSEKPMPDADNTGVSWYPRQDYQIRFRSGNRIEVAPGENTLFEAMKTVEDGDVLVLQSGDYLSTRTVEVPNTVTIIGADANAKPKLTFERSPLFSLENGGSLDLENLRISGADADDYSGNSVVRTSRYSMIDNYKLLVNSCEIIDLDVNHSFNFLKVYKNTFADSILLRNCTFSNISGHVLNMDKEIDDAGIYNAENVVVDGCQFTDVGGSAVKLYRGGRDESTFGPMVWISDSSFKNVGNDKRNKNESAIHLHGIQYADLSNLTMEDSRKMHLHLIVGDPVIKLSDINMKNTETMYANSSAYSAENVTQRIGSD